MIDHSSVRDHHYNFAICYGFMEGVGHSRRLRKLLTKVGIHFSTIAIADIIIAHSAGCLRMPVDAKPKLVVYTGMPLVLTRPQSTLIKASQPRFKDGNLKRELLTRLNNMYYGLRHAKRNLSIIRELKIAKPVIYPQAQSVFIANRYDPWPTGPELDKLIAKQPWAFISLSGTHDSLWKEPERYVEILEYYARLLAQTN